MNEYDEEKQVLDPGPHAMPDGSDEVPEGLPEPEDSGTLLGELRKKREAIAEETDLYLDLPGYDGQLIAHYKRLDYDQVRKIAERAEKSKNPNRMLFAQCDLIAEACIEILILKDGNREPLYHAFPELGDEPVRFDNRLGQALGFDPEGSARRAVLGCLNNPLAVAPHHNELALWMQTAEGLEAEDFIGLS